MGYIYLLSAILVENAGKVLEKYNFKRTGVRPTELLTYIFGVMALVATSYVVVNRTELPDLSAAVLLPLGFVVGLSFVSNVLDEMSLKINDLSLREPLSNFRPILAGFIGYTLFPEEREATLLLALIAGALVVLWGVKPRNLSKAQKRGVVYMMLAVIAEAGVTNAYVFALDGSRPEIIAMVRTISIFVLLVLFFRSKKRRYKTKHLSRVLGLVAGLAYGVGAIIRDLEDCPQ